MRRFSFRALRSSLAGFPRANDGTIAVVTGLLLPTLIGMTALVAEFGGGLLVKSENQRIADLSSYAGALAYGVAKSEDAMTKAANGIAALNHVAPEDVTVALLSSPRPGSDGAKAVAVTIATDRTLMLARLIGTQTKLTISSQAFAEVGGNGAKPACILALDAKQTGITLSGGTGIQAPNCAVTSNAQIKIAYCGPKINAKTIQYVSKLDVADPSWCTSFTGDVQKIAVTPDPFAEHAGILAATGRLTAVGNLANPPAPTVPSSTRNIHFTSNENQTAINGTIAQIGAVGCTGRYAGKIWTMECLSAGPYNINDFTTDGGIEVRVVTDATRRPTLNFAGVVSISGDRASFGAGTYNLAKGLVNAGGTTINFAAGAFSFGPASCGFSICGSKSVTFAGPSDFKFAAGIRSAGGTALSFGVGYANSFWIGSGTSGNAIVNEGGSLIELGSETISSSRFDIRGNVVTSGGACTVFSAATQHDIRGNLDLSSAIVLGTGTYTIDGWFAGGVGGGGSSSCKGSDISVKGNGVTLVLSGGSAPKGGCGGQAFCLGAGFKNATIKAPSAGSLAQVAVVGPIKSSAQNVGALFTSGAQGTGISGLLYFPKGPVATSGGASLSGAPGGCLQIVASHVTLSEGATVVSECAGLSGGGGAGAGRKISLVQ